MKSGRAALDLALVRALVGAFATVYLLVRLPYFADLGGLPPTQLAPVGVARLLSSPLPPAATWALALLAVGSGAAFTAGRWLRVSAPLFFASFLWVTTYRSSWGKILHSENLVAIHLGILAIGVLLSRDDDDDSARGTLRTLSAVTVATYVVAGVAKLRSGGGAWLSGEALGDWLVFDALRKAELGSFRSPLAAFVASRPPIVQALAIVTLVVELGAPLALVGPRASRAWCAAAWLFHLGILATMAIGFFYPISAVAFASLLVPSMPEWLRARAAPFGRLLLPASRG
ncbi:MAG: hypothetical protein JST00_22825 [Deltaproteobacteria bacterium]|nr:hypothetical protein [Deltaproteobacteria bacterium]